MQQTLFKETQLEMVFVILCRSQSVNVHYLSPLGNDEIDCCKWKKAFCNNEIVP